VFVAVLVGVDVAEITTIVTEVNAWAVEGSVAVKLITCGPASALVGVQLNVDCMGLEGAGTGKEAPEGRPRAARVTTSPASESAALTSKLRVLPAITVKVVPSGGVGGYTKNGGLLAPLTNRIKKSTGVLVTTFPNESRFSNITSVE
jgi:hypothetical protein